jgi:hypothetical protein
MSVEQPPIQIERRKNRPDAPLPAFQLERRNIPRTTTQPPFVAGATDPDLTRPSRTISPGKLLALLSVIAFVILACAGPVHDFLVKYNDNIVAILLGCFPAVVVVMFFVIRRVMAFWRANLKLAKEIESQRRAQILAARATSRKTDSDLHLLPWRPEQQSRAA